MERRTSKTVVAAIGAVAVLFLCLPGATRQIKRDNSHRSSNPLQIPLMRILQPPHEHGTTATTRTQDSELSEDTQDRGLDLAEIHGQCARGNPAGLTDRPLLIFKYARTGSTWLAWSGKTVRLASGLPMVWTHESQACSRDVTDHEGLSLWMREYFSRVTDGEMIFRGAKKKLKIKGKCSVTAGLDPNSDLGVLVATINPHDSHADTPDLTEQEWSDLFAAVPDLALGVLVRTNSVKRSVSSLAVREQVRICGGKKLHGGEDCINDLPKKIHLDLEDLWHKIEENEMKRTIMTDLASRLSLKYGDGRIFCLTYEGMQSDIAGEIDAMGEFLGASLDPESVEELRSGSVSYKRGSDDLSEYIENYDEVRESLSVNHCLLDQLESTEHRNFPLCGIWKGYNEDEKEE